MRCHLFLPLILITSPTSTQAIAQATITETMLVEYTTDGGVKLDLLNVTWHTTEIHVTLLGCDYGYNDEYLITPPLVKTWQTKVTPFHCIECVCEDFEFSRSEPFFITTP